MANKFHTRLSPTQAAKRLQSFFASRNRFDFAAKKTYEIAGYVKDRNFRFMIKNGIGRRYAFRPNMWGDITEGPQGSIVKYYFKMDRAEKMILLIWSIPLLVVTLFFAIRTFLIAPPAEMTTSDYYPFGIPLLMLVLTYIWYFISQWMINDRKKLKQFIFQAYQGSIIEQD